MDEKILCVMAGYEARTEQTLVALQNTLYARGFEGEQTKGLIPHITLGTFAPKEETRLVTQIQEVAQKTRAFDITFNHIGIFSGAKVLFVAPDVNRELLELKEHFGTSENWAAHTTMLIDTPEIIYQAVPVLMEQFSPFCGRVQCIHLYEFWPTRHICSIGLLQN